MNDEQRFIGGIRELAKSCNCMLSDWNMEAYLGAFRSIGYSQGVEAIKMAFMRIRGHGQMPSAIDLLELVGRKSPAAPNTRDEAMELVGQITAAMGRYGGYRAKDAKSALGEKAWVVVEQFGGWENLCMIDREQMPAVRAQLRDLTEAHIRIGFHRPAQELQTGKDQKFIESLINQVELPGFK